MVKSVRMTVTGIRIAQKFLKTKMTVKQKAINKAIHRAGLKVEAEVKQSIAGHRSEPVSVDTGRFLNSVKTDNSIKFISEVSSKVKYAKYLEFGTSRIRPRRHFKNTLDRMKSDIQADIAKASKA